MTPAGRVLVSQAPGKERGAARGLSLPWGPGPELLEPPSLGFAPGSRQHRSLQLLRASHSAVTFASGDESRMMLTYSWRVQIANSATKKPDTPAPPSSSAHFTRTVAAVVGEKNVKDLVS